MSVAAELLEAIREVAKPGTWSTGVNLARAGAVTLESREKDDVVMRVRAPGRPVAFSAILHLEYLEWECDCPSRLDVCEHAVAAAIAYQQRDSDAPAAAAAPVRYTRVIYRFSRVVGGGLTLARFLLAPDGTETLLAETLTAVLANPARAAKLQLEQHDLLADRLLERATRTALLPEKLDALMRVLEPARNVLLEGQEVAISAEVMHPRAVLQDRGDSVVLSLTRDARVTEVVSPSVALCGDTLCRLGDTELTGVWLQSLPLHRSYGPEQLGDLSGRVLPDLIRRFPVEIRSKRLPHIDRELVPRIVLELTQLDSVLSIFPTLVYGAPPSVRIDAGKMVYLQGSVPLRDEPAEQRLITGLREDLNLIPGRRSTVQGPEMVRLADKLRKWRGGLSGDGARILSPAAKLVPELSIDAGVDGVGGIPRMGFDLKFRIEGGDSSGQTLDAAAVIRAWKEGLGLVPIERGGWAPLPADWLAKNGAKVAELLASRQENGKLANHALVPLTELCDALEQPRPPGLEKLAPLLEGFERMPDAKLPDDVSATLRPYQLQGVAWLQFLRAAGLGGVLADDMGLGKTLQTLCVLGPGSLVVCPTSVLPNWAAEIKRFRPSLKVATYHGPGRVLDESADVTLTTYALMRLDEAILGARTWDTLVLDEAQAIKNPDSQVARAAFNLKATFRIALSGTPIENRLEELWSVMHYTNRGLLGGRRDFAQSFTEPINEGRTDVARVLRKKIRPFVLRRLKKDVAPELPPRTESVLHVTLDDAERVVYDTIHAATQAEVVKLLGEGGNVLKALEALLRLRQAACHSALVPGQHAKTSSKMKALMETLGTVVDEGHKALVFSQWTMLLDLIEPELTAAGISFSRLDGSTQNRGDVTAKFQADDGPPVMLISLKAGGTGLNLTAADHVFLVDPWWNPAVEAQAADRAHRIGQENPVNVYRLVSHGTVEEKILTLQDKKRALFEAALGEGTAAASLTRQDLLDLMQ